MAVWSSSGRRSTLPAARENASIGTRRGPFSPVSSMTASQAKRVEAESALVTPLQVLPPMVPAFLIWGPPTRSTASPRTLMYF